MPGSGKQAPHYDLICVPVPVLEVCSAESSGSLWSFNLIYGQRYTFVAAQQKQGR